MLAERSLLGHGRRAALPYAWDNYIPHQHTVVNLVEALASLPPLGVMLGQP